MHAWTERRGRSTSDNRAVCKGVVKKGMEQLDSMPRERSDNEITHEGTDYFALLLNMVCHPLSLRVKSAGMLQSHTSLASFSTKMEAREKESEEISWNTA